MIPWSDAARSRHHELRLEARPRPNDKMHVDLATPDEYSAGGEVPLPFGPDTVAAAEATARKQTEQYVARRLTELPPDPLRELGRQLFDAVFAFDRKVLFDRCRDAAREAETGLRLRIVLPRDANGPDLAWLPWEFLYDARRADFLALSVLTRVVRDSGRPPRDLVTLVPPPIRALVVTADLNGEMGAADEVSQLRRIAARSRGRLQVTVRPNRTADEFKAAVRAGGYHVLHFIGTATPAGPNGTGPAGLVLMPKRPKNPKAPKRRKPQPDTDDIPDDPVVTVGDLLGHTGRLPAGVRLVLLDACHSDELAARLAETVQAAVGVRGLITVNACTSFTLELYRAIARGEPLDTAVTAGRRQVDHRLSGSREWGLQTFYLQTPDGEFVRWPPPEGLAAGAADELYATRSGLPPAERKAALVRAILKCNQQALQDVKDRADGDVPDVVHEQLRVIRSQLKSL